MQQYTHLDGGGGGVARGVGEEGGGEQGDRRERRRWRRNADDTSEKDAAWSFVSFSLEKETKEPWPPPLLYL